MIVSIKNEVWYIMHSFLKKCTHYHSTAKESILRILHKTILILCLFLGGCITATPLQPRPDSWATSVAPASNLYQVDKNLYRSHQPTAEDRDWLARLQIKTIVNLRKSNPDKKQFPDFQLAHAPMNAATATPAQIALALHEIRTAQTQGNVLLHCLHGSDRTGVVIAMYRVIYQNWSITDAKTEMIQGGYGFNRLLTNLENMMTEEGVAKVKTALAGPCKLNCVFA
jgi:protein-tyrosine phosphatase